MLVRESKIEIRWLTVWGYNKAKSIEKAMWRDPFGSSIYTFYSKISGKNLSG